MGARTVKAWAAFRRGEFFGESEPPGPDIFVGVYASELEALKHCWPSGDSRWVREVEVQPERFDPTRNLSQDERDEIANALNEVWTYMRNVAPMVSGCDGWHNDCLLSAAAIVRAG